MYQARLHAFILLVCAMATSHAQSVSTGSITGRVISEDGRSIRAVVSLQPAVAPGYPFPTRRTFTKLDGSFTFAKLPATAYKICAQIPASEAQQPSVTPFLDTCAWGSTHPQVPVAAGVHVTGLVLTAPKGAWLKLRIADPDKVLPAVAANGPLALEPAIQFVVKGSDNPEHRARFVSADGAGRNYQMVVPVNAALKLSLTSSAGKLSDQNGSAIKATDALPVQAVSAAQPSQLTFTIHKSN